MITANGSRSRKNSNGAKNMKECLNVRIAAMYGMHCVSVAVKCTANKYK